jgi:hypothetical protein
MSGIPITFRSTRLSRLAILTVAGASALSIAACGASHNTGTSASPTSSAATSPSPNGKNSVSGMIASVADNAIQVTQQAGNATVDFTPSTKITEDTPAALTDVTAGSCVAVHPTKGSGNTGAITAQSVRVSPAVNGKCSEPKHHAGVAGIVASVAGNTITANGTVGNGSPSTVTVTDTTKYTKETVGDAHALAQGKCVAAQGTKDGSGTLQATAITVRQADNGSCQEPGAKRHPH